MVGVVIKPGPTVVVLMHFLLLILTCMFLLNLL